MWLCAYFHARGKERSGGRARFLLLLVSSFLVRLALVLSLSLTYMIAKDFTTGSRIFRSQLSTWVLPSKCTSKSWNTFLSLLRF